MPATIRPRSRRNRTAMRLLALVFFLLASPAFAADWTVGPAPRRRSRHEGRHGDERGRRRALSVEPRRRPPLPALRQSSTSGAARPSARRCRPIASTAARPSTPMWSARRARRSAPSGAMSAATPRSGWPGPRSESDPAERQLRALARRQGDRDQLPGPRRHGQRLTRFSLAGAAAAVHGATGLQTLSRRAGWNASRKAGTNC